MDDIYGYLMERASDGHGPRRVSPAEAAEGIRKSLGEGPPPTVTASVVDAVIVLTMDYPNKSATDHDVIEELGRCLCEGYRAHAEPRSHCVLAILPDVAGSRIVAAIFETYKVVDQNKGQLYLVGYPNEYLASMTALGMTTLPRFHMANTVAEAIEEAR